MASSASFTAAPLWKLVFTLIVLFGTQVFADSWHALCYFPNGDVSPDDTPCSASGGACCPKDWDCLSNGMCFLGDRHHERHSCTDQSWVDDRCPWMCATGGSAYRNEDIKLCIDDDEGSWCCNADPEGAIKNCCTEAAASVFSTELRTLLHHVSVDPSSATVSSAQALFSSTRDNDLSGGVTVTITTGATKSDESSTQTVTSITSNSAGQASTVVSIVVITAFPDSPTSSATAVPSLATESAYKDHTPAIIGGAIAGVSAAIVAAGYVCYLLYRRHQKRAVKENTCAYLPPDPPIPKLDTNPSVDAELYTHPNTFVELPTSESPIELDATPTSSPNPDLDHRVSAVSITTNDRWSAVSALTPPGTRSPTPSTGLQAVSRQQHYGNGQSYLLAPETAYRPYRPLSRTSAATGEHQQSVEHASRESHAGEQ